MFFKIRYIVDFDDAAFHDYDQHKNAIVRTLFQHKIEKVIKNASHVITGSPYLTAYATKYNNNITEIPTSIDLKKYYIKEQKLMEDKFVIGWIGSSTTSKNLLDLIPVFNRFMQEGINFELRFIGFDKKLSKNFVGLPISIIDWSEATELLEIHKFSVGIMPLEKNQFNNGKCAFKLIQYMACLQPTISTPLEANVKVDKGNGNLFASTEDEWYSALKEVQLDPIKFRGIGLKNRKIIEDFYSIQANSESYLNLFKNF
ncbi:glycosyltransferase [Lacinutrix sp.]|uniref:glycosyltransferase n=1 Tax=Lacinutrix sp. TaxID=1937692 RepID=UPI0026029D84|nr:glycosyltransferase [Lacinutrix sp.]MDG1715024.1 glycosyltransferase [Lacinutrix sp.]